jgi:hypothetical protein
MNGGTSTINHHLRRVQPRLNRHKNKDDNEGLKSQDSVSRAPSRQRQRQRRGSHGGGGRGGQARAQLRLEWYVFLCLFFILLY